MKKRDSIIFYRSFYEAINELEPEIQAQVYKAIFEYSLNFNQIELSGLSKTIFTLIKPQLEANNKKYENGSKGGRPPKNNQDETKEETKEEPKNNLNETEAKANVNDNENSNVNSNNNSNVKENSINIPFDDFWISYDKKVGEKEKIEKKWNKLKDSERDLIMKFIPEYKKSQPDKKYRKNPDTFLNQKTWNDELIFDSPNNQTKQFEKEDNQRGLVSAI